MDRVIITASTMMELSLLIAETAAVPVAGAGRLKAFQGAIASREVVIAVTGMGKVNAAAAGTVLMERFGPGLLINTGCGGAYQGAGLAVGDLAVASAETFADEGVDTLQGWRGLELIGIPVCSGPTGPVYNAVPLPRELAESALASAVSHCFRAVLGPFLTVSTCSGSAARGEEMLRRFPGICENMEGAALAQVALMYGVPFLEVRGISNMVEDRDLSRWDLAGAVSAAQRFLLKYLETTPSEV